MKMRMRSHIGRLVPAVVVAGLLFLAGCGGGSTSTTPPPPTPTPSATGPIMISPGTVSVPVGEQAQFSAFLASDPTATFTWSVSGGGTIDSASGLYTGPTSIPSPATVTITAKSSSVSGTALLTIVAAPAGGVAITPAAVVVPAGGSFQFSATANGNPVTPTWQVAGITLGDSVHGTIGPNGNYTAPFTPPPDGSTTVTALSGGNSATATVVVVFSNASLGGQYAFSYSGEDSKGPLMVAGSFTANSAAASITGIEDYNSTAQAPVTASPVSGTYSVNPDGSATATLTDAAAGGSATWNLTLVGSAQGQASPRALLVRFDKTATGSGEADAQNKTKFALGSFKQNYAFNLSGLDKSSKPLQITGMLNADGANGTIAPGLCEDDINDAGTNTEAAADTTLHGLFQADTANPTTLGTDGRGTLQLIYGATAGVTTFDNTTFTFAFYIVDSTHLKVVETDAKATAQLAGDLFSAPNTDGAFSDKILNGNYAFTLNGSNPSGTKAYAIGGVLETSGSGSVSGGLIDGNLGTDVTLTTSSYTVDTSLGRILFTTTIGSTTRYFAGYATSSGTVEMIELDTDLQASGTAYPQTSMGVPQGSFAFNLTSNGNTSSFEEEDVIGQVAVPGGTLVPQGNIDINDRGTLTSGMPIENTSTIVAPVNGRGTLTLDAKPASYALAYYVVDNTTALAIEIDRQRVATGIVLRQF